VSPPAGSTAAAATPKAVHVISIARANNIAIMLTQFSAWSDEEIRAAVLDDGRLSADKLSLLLQVWKPRLAQDNDVHMSMYVYEQVQLSVATSQHSNWSFWTSCIYSWESPRLTADRPS
jgi:hypothetical protein